MTKKNFFLSLFSSISLLLGSIGLNNECSAYSIYAQSFMEHKPEIIVLSILVLVIAFGLLFKSSLARKTKGFIYLFYGLIIFFNGLYIGYTTNLANEPQVYKYNLEEDNRIKEFKESERADREFREFNEKKGLWKPEIKTEKMKLEEAEYYLENIAHHEYTSKLPNWLYQLTKFFTIILFLIAGLYFIVVKME